MEDYYSRQLLFKEYDQDFEKLSLKVVTVIVFPRNGCVDPNDIRKKFEEILSSNPADGYEIEDKRTETQWGASGCSQEVIISFIVSVAGSATVDILKHLLIWAKEKIKEKPFTGTADEYIKKAKELVISTFGVKTTLEVSGISTQNKHKFEFILEDKSGNRYQAVFTFDGSIARLEKL